MNEYRYPNLYRLSIAYSFLTCQERNDVMAKAKKLPSGSWRVQVYAGKDQNGKKIMKSFTADTKKEAEFLAAQFAATNKEPATEMTVGKAIDKYIESKSNILSPTTISGYKEIRRNKFQQLMDIQLGKLTRTAVQAAVNVEAERLSPKSVQNAYGLLRAALDIYAPDLNVKVTLPKKIKQIRSMPEPEKIIEIIKGTEIELPCLLSIWLSLRMSEIRGLKKSDAQNGKLIVRKSIVTVNGEHIEKKMTKTYDSTRVEDIPEYIQNLIDALDPEQEYLTTLSGQAIYKRFIRLQEKNGIDPPIRFHDLRHLNASVMVKLHIPDKYAMERGGWSTTSTLRNVYQHTFSEEREAVNRKINEYFEGIIHSGE